MDGVDLAVVVGGVVLAVAVLAVLLWQWFPRPMSTDPSPDDEPALGPTGEPYPPDERPGGPAPRGWRWATTGATSWSPRPTRPTPASTPTPGADDAVWPIRRMGMLARS